MKNGQRYCSYFSLSHECELRIFCLNNSLFASSFDVQRFVERIGMFRWAVPIKGRFVISSIATWGIADHWAAASRENNDPMPRGPFENCSSCHNFSTLDIFCYLRRATSESRARRIRYNSLNHIRWGTTSLRLLFCLRYRTFCYLHLCFQSHLAFSNNLLEGFILLSSHWKFRIQYSTSVFSKQTSIFYYF